MNKEDLKEGIEFIERLTPLNELVYNPPVVFDAIDSNNVTDIHKALAYQSQGKDDIIRDLIIKVEDLTRVVNTLSVLIPSAIKYNARSKDFISK